MTINHRSIPGSAYPVSRCWEPNTYLFSVLAAVLKRIQPYVRCARGEEKEKKGHFRDREHSFENQYRWEEDVE